MGYTDIDENSIVSMNCWGFTPDIFKLIKDGFVPFFKENQNNLEKAEYFLPFVVNDNLKANKCDVKVLNTNAKWYGVTYHDDKKLIVDYLNHLTNTGVYPLNLWN